LRRARPSRSVTINCSGAPRTTACVTSQRRSAIERSSCQSMPSLDHSRAQSPVRRPARSARLPAIGAPITAFGSSMPIQCAAAYNTTASSRLAAGPAATIAARCGSGLRLKLRLNWSGATGPSRSSSILT
jgi:hypothetical protein